ncbi:MAG TPA: hypothetical protein VNH84_18370 [Candidatus Saccharimonadales bacterium]|jgi:hypothetical protein|nr:hypothetical protein [Candidatus Saccharimonadales bacterium]
MNASSASSPVRFPVLACLLLGLAASLPAADLALKTKQAPPPSELDPSIAGLLQKQSLQLAEGDDAAFEFWFVASLPLATKPASLPKALDSIKQTTLLGAVRVGKGRHDYRDDDIAPGVYTMRLAIQPNDGNHLGTAEFSWFAALIPARVDTKPDGIKDYKSLTKASSKETTTDHPVVLSMRPAGSADGQLPQLVEPAPEHKSLRVKLPGKAGEESSSVVFEVVYEGKGHK